MTRRFGIIFIVVAVSAGCSLQENPPDNFDFIGYPIINGEPDLRLSHMAVVALFNGLGMCSGTLIAPRVVLTAAHCANDAGQDIDPRNFLVLFGTDTGASMTRTVEETAVYPGYDPQGGETSAGDLALLLLSSGAPPGVSPIPPLTHLLQVTDADIGVPVEFVGFGQDENGQVGTKLAATNNIEMVCTDPGGCSQGLFFAERYTICQDQTPSGICFGDSGGPALIVRDSEEYVAGVSSYVYENCAMWGCSTKVDEYQGFIDDFVQGRPGASCSSGADCRSGFCTDGICCEEACGGPCRSCAVPGSLGSCKSSPDGSACPDGDKCNGDEICESAICLAGTALVCDDSNPCTSDACFAASGCVFEQLDNGTPCDNDDLCDGRETCRSGFCTDGDIPTCDDQNPCTRDSCDSQSGCLNQAVADGTDCGTSPCGDMQCRAGTCEISSDISCDDDNPCTRDSCDAQTGCVNEPWPDGMKCGECLVCRDNQCVDDPDCKSAGGCGCGSVGNGADNLLLFIGFLMLAWFFGRRSARVFRGRRRRPS
jgi:hypothetical protein